MSSAALAERLSPVTTSETRGNQIDARMKALGMGATEMSKEADVSRALVYRVLGDRPGVSSNSYARIEHALDRIEAEFTGGADAVRESTEEGLIEFEVTGDFGVRVVVRGPVHDAVELEASVARLIRDIRKRPADE